MRVLVPLPDRDFDPTEVAVPWRGLTDAGHELIFATERRRAAADMRPAAAHRGPLRPARRRGGRYRRLRRDDRGAGVSCADPVGGGRGHGLRRPHPPGWACAGHASVPRQPALQEKVAGFWALSRPVGAICHGVLVLARTTEGATGRSVIAGRSTTCLPKYMERTAFWLTAWKLGRYYRTYPAYVEDEVRDALSGSRPLRSRPADSWPRQDRTRQRPGLHRARRPLRVGPLAWRRLPVHIQIPSGARRRLRARRHSRRVVRPARLLRRRRAGVVLRDQDREQGSDIDVTSELAAQVASELSRCKRSAGPPACGRCTPPPPDR